MLITMRLGEWFQIIVPKKWAGKTIEEIFRHEWEAPKKLTHAFRMEKKVQVDGKEYSWTAPLSEGSKLQIQLFTEEEPHAIPNYLDIDVLFEDDHLLIMNKPPFMNTHPNDPEKDTETLINAAAFYLQAKGEIRDVHQIHRLDRDTSGAILLAKNALAGALLDGKLAKREIKRTYLALVHGLLRQKKGTINAPIGRDRHHPTKRRVSPSGQAAITHYQVVKEDRKRNLSYVKCWLDSGRTHQIRVHLSHLGHPLVGDVVYGGKPLVNRQALHAGKLTLTHPLTEEKIVVYGPFTDDPIIFKEFDIYSL